MGTNIRLGEEAQADNFRDDPRFVETPLESAQRPWQVMLVIGIVVVLLIASGMALLGFYRLIVCWGMGEFNRSTECESVIRAQMVIAWIIPAGILLSGIIAAGVYISRSVVLVRRISVVRDEAGVPISTRLIHGKTADFYLGERAQVSDRMIEMARAQPFGRGVDSLTYHNEISTRGGEILDADEIAEGDGELAALEDKMSPIPGESMLGRLIQQGFIRFSEYDLFVGAAADARGNAMPGKPIHLKWSRQKAGNEPVITALAGLPGSGKTYLARSLIAQAVAKNIQVILCDPNHKSDQGIMAGIEELESLLGFPVAQVPAAIVAGIARAHQILDARRTGNDPSRQGLLLVVDEFTSIVVGFSQRDEITDQLIEIGANGRHYGVRVVLIGQAWQTNVVGDDRGGALRDLISLKIIGNSNPRQLGMLTYGLPAADKSALEKVSPPYMYVYASGTLTRTVIPTILDDHLVADVLRIRGGGAPQGAPAAPQQGEDDALLYGLLNPGIALGRAGSGGSGKTPTSNLGLPPDPAPDPDPEDDAAWGDDPVDVKRFIVRRLMRKGWTSNRIQEVVRGRNGLVAELIAEFEAEQAGEARP